jgi:hypothetical protein
MLETCVYSYNNICNIQLKHLKHTSETPETLKNICLQHAILSLQYMQHLRYNFAISR